MDPTSLASQHVTPQMSTVSHDSWTTLPLTLPSRPARVAQPQYTFPSSSRQSANAEYPVHYQEHAQPKHISSNYHRESLTQPAPGTSVSSAGGTSVMTGRTVDTIDLEKGSILAESRRSSSGGGRKSSRHKSKGRREMSERHSMAYTASNHGDESRHTSPYQREASIDEEQEMLDQRRLQESKAVKILLFLSGPCAALSFILCIYSLLSTLAILVSTPLRLCTKPRCSLWDQILCTLTSAQRLQLRCIYSSSPVVGKSVAALLANLLLSPFLSMGVAVAAWTVAMYWVFAAIVGDPDGSEGGNDGVETVLGLRGWWERWLVRAMLE